MSNDTLSFGRFEILLAERRLQVDGQAVALGSRAFDLLAALATRRDRVVPKDELIEVVWPGLVVEDNNLQVQISALRKVLGAQSIATVPGRGYQFTVASVSAPSASASSLPPAPADAAGARVSRLLVADDNKVNRLLLCRSLELMGHDVSSAENGRVALDKLRNGRYDLILLDLEMPEMDGFSLLEQRAADPVLRELPVIVTSSLEGVAQVARCIELGADDYLHKPVNPVLLKARVDASLERKHLRDRERELLARAAPGLTDGMRGGAAAPRASRVEATVLVARARGFDSPSQPAQETLELLSNWATLMLDAVESRGGRLIELAGDKVSAMFGIGDDSAVQTAQEMHELVAAFNSERVAAGKAPIALAVGIAAGEVVAGEAGTARRAAFVCVGEAMQRAAALEAHATLVGDAVLIDAATFAAVAGRFDRGAVRKVVLPGGAGAATAHALGL